MSPRLAAESQTPKRLKMIEYAIEEKAPKMYRELRKSGGLRKFAENVDQNLLDSYQESLIRANQHLPDVKDPLEHQQNCVEADRRAWEEALETWLEFSDGPEDSTT